ncbi:hypothetical protein [Micromonospora sediminicola]|uniref:hypothetical protein n=1 Tax=Micromonospora sediminicola TaxID=946078 RepID=UPI0037BABBF2
MTTRPNTLIPPPEPFTTVNPTPATGGNGVWAETVDAWLSTVPGWAWLALAGSLFVLLMITRHRLDKAQRLTPRKAGAKLGGLFGAAVTFAALLWAGVLAGSAKNLAGWGSDTLGWNQGWEYLVPVTLDGVAIAFAVLTFAAVRANKPANRAFRVVAAATAVSALIGFSHEYDGSIKSTFAALYLAFLALGAMAILHELLDLFRSHTSTRVARVSPVFGLRWITYLPNTVCAWLAWQNHPPRPLPPNPSAEQVAWFGSVRHAVAHLDTVRRAKRVARYRVDRIAGGQPAAGWARILPWLRARELSAALAARREHSAAELDRQRQEVDRQIAAADARATEAHTAADLARQQAAADIAAATQTAVVHAARVAELDAALTAAREEIGRLRGEQHTARSEADRAAADAAHARQQLADAQAAHRDEMTAAVERLTRERDSAVGRLLTPPAHSDRAARSTHGQTAPRPSNTAPRAAGGQDRSPTSPPWNEQQQEAFRLRDGDPKAWTWPALAAHFGVGVNTVRRWFDNRKKHQVETVTPAVPTTPIPEPKQPATAGLNGIHVNH